MKDHNVLAEEEVESTFVKAGRSRTFSQETTSLTRLIRCSCCGELAFLVSTNDEKGDTVNIQLPVDTVFEFFQRKEIIEEVTREK